MKKVFATVIIALCCIGAAWAVPAYRGLIRHTQPDGSVIMIRIHGDEFCHWVTDASGQVLERDADGYYRPASTSASLSARRAAGQIRRNASNAARRLSPGKRGMASGQKHFLVILVQFSDVKFASESTAQQDFTDMLNQHNYSTNGGTGSARDFYYDNSHGDFEPIFDVYGPVTLNNTQAYYGGNNNSGNDLRPHYAVRDGCNGLNSQIDFSQYDNDGDGEVDLVFMYYAGNGEADSDVEDSIWPHQWELSSGKISLTLDGKKIDKYACTNEIIGNYGTYPGTMCGIGTACHEFGHAMGLPDFYDTDYEDNGLSAGMFSFSTMDSGSYNNDGRTPPYFTIEERIILGWITEADAFRTFDASGSYTIETVDNNIAYRTFTDQEGEYFVYECRGSNGWDAGLPSHGLIVTHVDKSSRSVSIGGGSCTAAELWSDWQLTNSINENGSHPCCYVVPAPDQSNLKFGYKYYEQYDAYYYNSSNDVKIPFPGSQNVTTYTARSWNNEDSAIQLSNIAYSNNQVTLYAAVPSPTLLNYNVIANPGNGVYSAGSSFALELVDSAAQPVASVQWYLDDEPVYGSSVVLTAGTHLIEANITLASGQVKIVELTVTAQ